MLLWDSDLLFPRPPYSCPTCCWTVQEQTRSLGCIRCSTGKASKSTPNLSRKSSESSCARLSCTIIPGVVPKQSPSDFQVHVCRQVWLRQALQRPGAVRPGSHAHFLQRDGGGGAELHVEKLQDAGVPGAAAEARQLPEHHHHLPKTRQEHLPHHSQLQSHGRSPLVCVHGAAGV